MWLVFLFFCVITVVESYPSDSNEWEEPNSDDPVNIRLKRGYIQVPTRNTANGYRVNRPQPGVQRSGGKIDATAGSQIREVQPPRRRQKVQRPKVQRGNRQSNLGDGCKVLGISNNLQCNNYCRRFYPRCTSGRCEGWANQSCQCKDKYDNNC